MNKTKHAIVKKENNMNQKKGIIAEFKEFISRGSVIDLAVGVIIGSAFTAIVNSLVNDIVMPFIGWLFGGIKFTSLKYIITPASGEIPEAAIYYGNFIQNIVDFFLISLVIFAAVKGINRFRRKEEKVSDTPPEPAEEIILLREIRDLLKQQDE